MSVPAANRLCEVETVRWPVDAERLARLREAGRPRLLVVEETSEPPVAADCLEDWVVEGASDREIDTRRRALVQRARVHAVSPRIDGDGLLHFRDRWVSLSPVEQSIAAVLLERFGTVVPREVVTERAWPRGAPTRNALDVHVLRLRRRISAVGLEIRTVRSRGYLLQPE